MPDKLMVLPKLNNKALQTEPGLTILKKPLR